MSIPGYDAWKTRAPEDEPGYWDDKEPEEDESEGAKLNAAYNDGWNDAMAEARKMALHLASELFKLKVDIKEDA